MFYLCSYYLFMANKNRTKIDAVKDTQFLFIDMNAFFASCEQQTNPNLRYKPVAVAPFKGDSGCIISPSYEAKAYGIKTGMLVKKAKEICPKITILESDVSKYLKIHNKIKQILFSFSPFVKVLSVDEAAIYLSPSEQKTRVAFDIALKIKQAIYEKIGKYMHSSVGIGPSIYMAKQASEIEKPNGLKEIKLKEIPKYLSTISLTDLKGINTRTKIRLNNLEIYTPLDLYHTPVQNLREKLGIAGEYWYLILRGQDITNFEACEKSIGHSHVLEPKYRNWNCAWSVCQKLISKAGYRLRKAGLVAGGIYLQINCFNKYSFHKALKTNTFSDDYNFSRHIKFLFEKINRLNKPIRVAVGLFNLNKSNFFQNDLFFKNYKNKLIYDVVDKVNDKYGAFTIKSASILLVEDSAPNRISFGKPDKNF